MEIIATMFRKKTLRHTDFETSSQPSKESKKRQRNRSGGRADSYASSSNTIDEIIRDEDYEIQSVIDVSSNGCCEGRFFRRCCNRRCFISLCTKLRKMIAFVFTQVGFFFIVGLYCVLGALIFTFLENPHEIEVKRSIKTLRNSVSNDLWKFTSSHLENPAMVIYPDYDHKENGTMVNEEWVKNVTDRIIEFEAALMSKLKQEGWNGLEDEEKNQWTFVGSLFYSIICLTTIGYGDQTPKTSAGKFWTLIFAFVGVPMMLLFIAQTGDSMADLFRWIYWKYCCLLCSPPKRKKYRPKLRTRSSLYTQPLSHPVSAITGSMRSAQTELHSPMSGMPVLPTAKLPPFKIGNNMETFSNLVNKYNHATSTQSIEKSGVDKKRRGVRRTMSVRSRGSDTRSKYNRYKRRLSADFTNIHRVNSSTSIPSVTKSNKTNDNGSPGMNALPFLKVDVIAPTPTATPLPPEVNTSEDSINVSINHNNVKINYNVDYENVRNVCIPRNNSNPENRLLSQTGSNEYRNMNETENIKSSMPDILAPQVLLETSFDQISKSTEEIPQATESLTGKNSENFRSRKNHFRGDNNSANQLNSNCSQSSNQLPSLSLEVEDPILKRGELRSSIRSTRSGVASRPGRLSVDQTYFDRAPLRSSLRNSRPDRKSLSLSIPYESTKASSSDPSSPSTPTTRKNLYLPVRRPSLLESVLNMTKEISTNKTATDSSRDSPNYPENSSTESNYEKKTVPLWIIGVMLISYIVGGAALFSNRERDWKGDNWRFLDSAYFCFTTLTTIGFGDFVPSHSYESDSHGAAICIVYLLFGMALFVMAFNLMQEEVVQRARYVGQNLGIIKRDSFESD